MTAKCNIFSVLGLMVGLLVSGAAQAVTLDQVSANGDVLEGLTPGTVTVSGTGDGETFAVTDFDGFFATNLAESLLSPVQVNPEFSTLSALVGVISIEFGFGSTYLSGDLEDARIVSSTNTIEVLFSRTDSATALFGDYLILRFYTGSSAIIDGAISFSSADVLGAVTSVPVPGALVLMLTGLVGLGSIRARRAAA